MCSECKSCLARVCERQPNFERIYDPNSDEEGRPHVDRGALCRPAHGELAFGNGMSRQPHGVAAWTAGDARSRDEVARQTSVSLRALPTTTGG